MKKKAKAKLASMHRWVPDPHNRARTIPNKKAYSRKGKVRKELPLRNALAA